MITVKIVYTRTKKSHDDFYIIHDFLVEGHANDGSINSIKCCAGVSAILCGVYRLMNDYYDKLVMRKGYFHYSLITRSNREYQRNETFYVLNTVWCLLYEVYKCYPQFFTKFEMIEKEGN